MKRFSMNAKDAKKAIYGQLEFLLSKNKKEIISKLIERGCRPATAEKMHREVWRGLWNNEHKQYAVRLSTMEKRMLELCIDGSETFDFIGSARKKRGEKLVKLGYLRAETQTNQYGLKWTQYTTTEDGKQKLLEL